MARSRGEEGPIGVPVQCGPSFDSVSRSLSGSLKLSSDFSVTNTFISGRTFLDVPKREGWGLGRV